MDCGQAEQLFDAYLDGELSASLATELGTHRVDCAQCRRALAILEVTGHIIACDEEPVTLDESFSERLLACTELTTQRWTSRFRRRLYIAGPLAAAAVIALAFLGVFDGGSNRVAGERGKGTVTKNSGLAAPVSSQTPGPNDRGVEELELERWFQRTQENLDKKGKGLESLRKEFDMTIFQLLDVLNEAKDRSRDVDHFPPAEPKAPTPLKPAQPESDDVEGM